MRYHFDVIRFLALAVLLTAATTTAFAAPPIHADDTGLSKGSVFDTPTPEVYHYSMTPAGESKVLPRAYSGAPPQISHDISEHLPITMQNNMCLACHNQPALWDKKLERGTPTPIPPSHYTDLRNAPGKVTENVVGARYNCIQCHVPQADARPLVENTFPAGRSR
jgi:cytochrome c-type protein NapB